MKHRATGILIIIVATLVVAPRASQQLVALKDAAGNRLQATLWNAFLSLHGQQVETGSQPTVAQIQPASRTETEIAGWDKKSVEAADHTRDNSRTSVRRDAEKQIPQPHMAEPLIAKFEDPERLSSFDPEAEHSGRFQVSEELPFDLDQLIKSVPEVARAKTVTARALDEKYRKLKIYALSKEIAFNRAPAAPPAPRTRASKDARRRSSAGVRNIEWEGPVPAFGFNLQSRETETPRHAEQYHSEQ